MNSVPWFEKHLAQAIERGRRFDPAVSRLIRCQDTAELMRVTAVKAWLKGAITSLNSRYIRIATSCVVFSVTGLAREHEVRTQYKGVVVLSKPSISSKSSEAVIASCNPKQRIGSEPMFAPKPLQEIADIYLELLNTSPVRHMVIHPRS